jgi:hypothetical protein
MKPLVIEEIIPEVGRLTLEQLIRAECYRIPEFQRPYAWKQAQVEQFWEDIYTGYVNKEPRFFGIMVFQRERAKEALSVIDGHQRLCTVFTTLLIIRKLLQDKGESIGRLDDYLWKFDIHGKQQQPRLQLLNPQDAGFFRSLLRGQPDERFKESRLYKAYSLISEKLKEESNLLDFVHYLLDNVYVVRIIVGEQGDPFSIFEVLNARGLELTCWDLTKNKLLSEASKQRNEEETKRFINEIEAQEIEGSRVDPDFLTKFLRHYWLSAHQRVSKQELYRTISNFLAEQRVRPSDFANEIRGELDIYIDLVDPEDDIPEAQDLRDLSDCGFEQGRPLLMAVRKKGKPEDFSQALDVVKTLHVRYHVCELNPNELERFFSQSAIAFRRQEKSINEIINEARKLMPNDEEFKEKITQQDLGVKLAKFLLRKIEEARLTSASLGERPLGRNLDLEHIMPRKRPKEQEWPNYDAELVNKLGNLTLIGPEYNRRMRNKGFEKKKKEFEKSELSITRELLNYRSWGKTEIEERGKRLAAEAVRIFSL